MKDNNVNDRNYEKGITLGALIVTIIILLIMVGVSLNIVVGEDGIIGKAIVAKERQEITEEQEIIQLYVATALSKNKGDIFSREDLQDAVDSYAKDSIEVLNDGDNFAFHFTETDRYYTIDGNGKVENIEVTIDKNPGNIKKGITGNDLAGTSEDTAFEIWCIEDLVEWSKNYNTYKTSYIKLCKDLDFKSELSYADAQNTSYGNINGDEQTEALIQELHTGSGFTPIASFAGTFDGQNKTINHLYINITTGNVGLLGSEISGTIKNLGMLNSNITGGECVGGVVASCSGTIENCYNTGNINATGSHCGGIIGYLMAGGTIRYCYNIGTIDGKASNVGGVVRKKLKWYNRKML